MIRENVVNLRVIIATAVVINLAMCYQHLTLIATLVVASPVHASHCLTQHAA